MKDLKPARNVRRANPRVCGNCRHGKNDDGAFFCNRPNGPGWDVGDMQHWLHTCDLWQVWKDDGPATVEPVNYYQ